MTKNTKIDFFPIFTQNWGGPLQYLTKMMTNHCQTVNSRTLKPLFRFGMLQWPSVQIWGESPTGVLWTRSLGWRREFYIYNRNSAITYNVFSGNTTGLTVSRHPVTEGTSTSLAGPTIYFEWFFCLLPRSFGICWSWKYWMRVSWWTSTHKALQNPNSNF